MEDGNAAGRKTENPAPRPNGYAHHVDALLDLMTGGVRDALERAGGQTPQSDEYGHKRGTEIDNVIKLGTLSTQLVVALGKLGGSHEK